MKYTAVGPKLIEVNARMGGFYIREWTQLIYGIDLALLAVMCACHIEPPHIGVPDAAVCVVGCQLFASHHRLALESFCTPQRLMQINEKRSMVYATMFEAEITDVEEYEEPIGNVACIGASFDEARNRLLAVITSMGLDDSGKELAKGELPTSWYVEHLPDL